MEVKDIIAYGRFLINPKDSLSLLRIINTPKRSIGKTTIDQLSELAQRKGVTLAELVMHPDHGLYDISPSVQQKIRQFATLMQSIQQSISLFTPAQLLEQIVSSIGYKAYLIKEEGEEKGNEKMENV